MIPGLGISPGEVNGNLFLYPCLKNSMDKRNLVGYSPPQVHKEFQPLNHQKSSLYCSFFFLWIYSFNYFSFLSADFTWICCMFIWNGQFTLIFWSCVRLKTKKVPYFLPERQSFIPAFIQKFSFSQLNWNATFLCIKCSYLISSNSYSFNK